MQDNKRTDLHHAVLCDDVFKLKTLLDQVAWNSFKLESLSRRAEHLRFAVLS